MDCLYVQDEIASGSIHSNLVREPYAIRISIVRVIGFHFVGNLPPVLLQANSLH